MKVLLVKHCGNIRFSGKETNGGATEIAVVAAEMRRCGHEISVVTIERYHKDAPSWVKCYAWDHISLGQAMEANDIAIVFNGQLNPMGGVLSGVVLASYTFLHKFSAIKPTIYAVTDTTIPLNSLSDWIAGAHKKGHYTELDPSYYAFDAARIYCMTQAYDISKFKTLWKGETNRFGAYGHLPFEWTVLKRDHLQTSINGASTNDLIYFGNPRGGKRDKKLAKFYIDADLDIQMEIYGNWKENNIRNVMKHAHSPRQPHFMGKCDMYELHSKINSSIAHCYISDPANEGIIWTTRFYEAIMNRCILFIDIDNDKKMARFKDSFFYVRDGAELSAKIRMLQKDHQFRVQKLNEQMLSLGTIFSAMPQYGNVINYHLTRAKELISGTGV